MLISTVKQSDSVIHTHRFFYKIFNNLIVFGCAGSSLLHGLFSSCSEWGLHFVAIQGLLIVVASLVAAPGL